MRKSSIGMMLNPEATGGPSWWHHHGWKMEVKELLLDQRKLTIEGSAARVVIQRAADVLPNFESSHGWIVEWEVLQGDSYGKPDGGQRYWTDGDLAAAFATDGTRDAARQGNYARNGHFLNIPCMGTGHDGDPNVSIDVTGEITEAVRSLFVRPRVSA